MAAVSEFLRRRWRMLLIGGGIAVVALVWAFFPTIIGGVPERLITGAVAVSDVSCTDCPFFDLDSVDVGVSDGTYSTQDLQAAQSDGESLRWSVVEGFGAPTVDFSVGNATDDEQVLIRNLALEVRDHAEVSDPMSLGCYAGYPETRQPVSPGPGVQQGDPAQAITFSMNLAPDMSGSSQTIPTTPDDSVGLELNPEQLQAYRGTFSFAEPGVYQLVVLMEYETTEGETSTAESDPIELALVPDSVSAKVVPASGSGVCAVAGFPGSGPPSLLEDVRITGSEGGAEVTFHFRDDPPPFSVAYVEPPFRQRPSGRTIEVAGDSFVEVSLVPASGFERSEEGATEVYTGPGRIEASSDLLTEAVLIEDNAGVMTWVIGVEGTASFSFSTSLDPAVVQVALSLGAAGD